MRKRESLMSTARTNFTIRPATADDLPTINDIYNHYVLHSTCTYQVEPSTMEERREWFAHHDDKHPVIVGCENGVVRAWASLSKFHPREAYSRTVENSIYVHHEHHRRGLGRLLTEEMIQQAKLLGHHTIIASISADQTGSVALHEVLGFRKAAHLKEVGVKFGRWLDVVWLQLML